MKYAKFLIILRVVRYSAEVAIFIIVCILVSLSSKDPFKSHTIGNITNYFNLFPGATISLVNSICICKN